MDDNSWLIAVATADDTGQWKNFFFFLFLVPSLFDGETALKQ